MTSRSDKERFELSILGGVTERRYRALRPDIEQLPWGTLDLAGFSEEQIVLARELWSDLCVQEYAAAARQGEIFRLILRARIPLDLSAVFTVFPLDELAHAEICARMANDLGGAAVIEYRREDVFPSPAREEGSPLLAAAHAVLWDFCVAETFSHGVLVSHFTNAAQPLLREVWGRLARDEAVHMQFGWTFFEWLLPELSAAEISALTVTAANAVASVASLETKVRGLAPAAFSSVSVFGAGGRDAYLTLCEAVIRERVRDRLRGLGLDAEVPA